MHIERLKVIRAIGLPPDLDKRIHQNRLLRLARESAQTAVYHLSDYEPGRRYATVNGPPLIRDPIQVTASFCKPLRLKLPDALAALVPHGPKRDLPARLGQTEVRMVLLSAGH
jgi:predicted P-loop ATPase/GTPase